MDEPRTLPRVSTGILAGVAGALVLIISGLLLRDRHPRIDSWGLETFRVVPGSTVESIASVASEGLRIASMAGAVAAIGWLLWRRRRSALGSSVACLALLLLAPASSQLLKELIERPHPVETGEWSYPSTHVAMVTVGAIITAVTVARLLPRWRSVAAVLAVAAVAGTAATLVVLGEHRLTDVAAAAVSYAALSLAVALLSTPALLMVTSARRPTIRRPKAGSRR